jgi:DUF917 family protein
VTESGRPLSRRDLEDLVEGAALLGAGGGGPRWVGLQVITAIAEADKWPRLLQPEDLDADARVAGTASLALPNALSASDQFPWWLSECAFTALESAYGHTLDAVLPIALGPANALLPAIVAAKLGRPLVDVAAAPRACPFLAGYSYASLSGPLLAALAMPGRAPQILRAPSAVEMQQILMKEVQSQGSPGIASLALFAMPANKLRQIAYYYGVSKAIDLGRTIRSAREQQRDPVEAACSALGGKVVFRASRATDVPNKSGSSALTFESLDGRSHLLVYHLAENLLAWREGDLTPTAMGPDIVTYLTADGLTFTNDAVDLAAVSGHELVVIAAAVPEEWRASSMVSGWSAGIAATTAYAGAYVPTWRSREIAHTKSWPSLRDELIHLLTEAAEIEHLICCQYLYAAFSLKQGESEGLDWREAMHTRNWAQLLLLIARQEMEHLALVSNLLTSFGGAPHFERPNFPQSKRYSELQFRLVPFSEEMLRRFICLERPLNVPWREACGPDLLEPPKPDLSAPVGLEFSGEAKESLAALYDHIGRLISNSSDNDALFIGPPNAQISGDILHVNFPRPGAIGGVWDVTLFDITDRQTALRAIKLIVDQGEGGRGAEEYTHYRWFREMLEQYLGARMDNPKFEPARLLVSNPILNQHSDAGRGGTLITNPATRDVLCLFNGVYETLLLLLYRLYANPEMTANQVTALAYTMFPLMTQVIRPIAEILTALPAYDYPSPFRAGPSFEITNAIDLLSHPASAFRVLTEKLSALSLYANELGARADLPDRLTSIGHNLFIMAKKFESVAAGNYPPDLLVPGVAHYYTQRSQN